MASRKIQHTPDSAALRRSHRPDDCRPLREAVVRGETTMFALARGQYPGRPIPAGRLPGLRSIGYWDAVGPQSWGLPMHRNEGVEICCLLSGETAFATDHGAFHLRPGDLTITRPWQRHRLGDPHIGACRLFWLILDVEKHAGSASWTLPPWVGPDVDSRREMLRTLRHNQHCHFPAGGDGLRDTLTKECRLLESDRDLRWARAAAVVNDVLLRVAAVLSSHVRPVRADPHGFGETVRGFFRGLEASAETAAEPWTVGEMARACRVGVTYMTACCRSLFNTTPSEQLCRVRLAHAARLLRDHPARTVTEVAFAVGFASSQHFATRFRRRYGRPPTGFRGAAPSIRGRG